MKWLIAVLATSVALSGCAISPVDPDVRPYDVNDAGFQRAYLANQFSYCEPVEGRVIVVPAGFRTDYTSIPWPVTYIFPRSEGRYVNAAFIHDYLYALGAPGQRAFADRVMLQAMDEYDVGWVTRHAIYLGVRFGGQFGGYGKPGDWAFVRADGSVDQNVPRPERTYKLILPGCVGYADMVISGELFDGPGAPFGRLPSDTSAQDSPDQP